jgi:hypothetical protein
MSKTKLTPIELEILTPLLEKATDDKFLRQSMKLSLWAADAAESLGQAGAVELLTAYLLKALRVTCKPGHEAELADKMSELFRKELLAGVENTPSYDHENFEDYELGEDSLTMTDDLTAMSDEEFEEFARQYEVTRADVEGQEKSLNSLTGLMRALDKKNTTRH